MNYLHTQHSLLNGNLKQLLCTQSLCNYCFTISGIENISFGQNSRWAGLVTSTTEFKVGNTY